MKRVVWAALAASAALLAGCNSPHIALGQDNAVTVPVGGSFAFSGIIQDANGTILWKLDGPGSITNSSGLTTTYTAPATYPSTNKATLVASLSEAPDEKQTVTITITKPSSSVGGVPGLVSAVSVTYDERDIPTINCTKSVDCYAVLGFIHARDRLFQMDVYRRAARGHISELIGDAALPLDQAIRTFFTTRDGQSMPEALHAHWLSDTVMAPRFAAYTAGVNAFIAQVRADPTKLPAAYEQLQYVIDPTKADDLPDWSDVDTVAVARLFQFSLSETAEQEADYGKWAQTWSALIQGGTAVDPGKLTIGLWIQAKSPIEAFTLAGSGAPNAPSLIAQPGTLDSLREAGGALDGAAKTLDALRSLRALIGVPAGSNNWVVDKDHTDIGQAFVANDPHLSLEYPTHFHLAHLIGTEDQLNVMGGSFPGVPVTLIGRGTHVGWGVTVVGYDVTDLYVEKLVFQGQTPVGIEFKGNTVAFIAVPQTYKFRTATGLATATNTPPVLVAPPHGPVISLDATGGTAVTVRWTGQESQSDDLHAYFRLNNAASVDDARQALEGDPAPDGGFYTGYFTGAQNFVLADDQGHIGYVPHACVPQRPWAASALVYPYPVVPLDGRSGNFEWATGPDGGLACVPNDKLPKAIGSTKGYLATANADPLGVTADNDPYANNPGGVPYLSFEWTDMGYRIARIQEVLDAKTANGGKVTLADMQALQADHVVILARQFGAYIQALDQAQQIPAGSNAALAASILLAWGSADAGTPFDCPTGLAAGALDPATALNDPNTTNSANSKACLLFHTFLRRVLEQTFSDEEAAANVGRSPGNEVRALITLLSGQVPNPNNVFCRVVDTKGQTVDNKSCAAQVMDALGFAYVQLKNAYGDEKNWRWGRVHTISFPFPPFISDYFSYPLIDPGFRPGPYPRPGGAWTVDVGAPDQLSSADLTFDYRSGGNVRWLAAMDGTVAHTFMQLPGVESEAPYPFGKSTMLTQWVLNQYFNWPHNAADVTSVRSESYSP
ncbi:MAG TPA: penicillin acylase family protein [Myxococcaceae bacterium]|nr:penicillin acylase family protein [Myxococcaceae bacterium]